MPGTFPPCPPSVLHRLALCPTLTRLKASTCRFLCTLQGTETMTCLLWISLHRPERAQARGRAVCTHGPLASGAARRGGIHEGGTTEPQEAGGGETEKAPRQEEQAQWGWRWGGPPEKEFMRPNSSFLKDSFLFWVKQEGTPKAPCREQSWSTATWCYYRAGLGTMDGERVWGSQPISPTHGHLQALPIATNILSQPAPNHS